jgi:hypothetical protein
VKIDLAIALFKLITALVRFFEQQHWYQEGRDAANAEANAEQQRRIDLANAARADADDLGVPDPRQRD